MLSTIEDLLAWGASLHYPFLVLDRATKDYLRAGEQAWRTLLASHDDERIGRLRARRERWHELEKKQCNAH